MKKTSVNKNKTSNIWKLAFGLLLVAVLSPPSLFAEPSVVDFSSQTTMMNTGIEAGDGFGIIDASGLVKVKLVSQGNVNTETLNILLTHLNPNTTYHLVALLGDDTNAVSITNFTTSATGSYSSSYIKSSRIQNGSVKMMPDALDPLCNVRELDIVNEGDEIVLQANLSDPDQGKYLVIRSMINTGFVPAAVGNLTIQADAQSTRFRLQASHLTPNTNYRLVVNDTIGAPSESDSTGKLNLTNLPPESPALLDIQVVALTDNTGTNIVLITEGLGIPCTLVGDLLPAVISTIPTNTATGVAINGNIAATFNEVMDLSTLGNASFMLKQGTTNVSGAVTYAGVTAVFNPANNLKPNTLYTATITTGVRDLTENKLATNYVWSFTTGAQIDPNVNSKSINLGAASTFAILATAGISGAGDQINGNVGLSPGSAQGIDPSEINGTVDVNDPAVIDAQADLLSAYNQVVSRSVNAISLPGNLGGLTLAPGLYVNGSSSGISGTGPQGILTLDGHGNANAVFIFKMASTLTTDPATSIVLSGGAQAKNIFWQVGSSATLGTTSVFKGNIMAAVSITVNNGAVVTGRLFAGSGGDASGAVTVQSSTVTVP